MAILRGSGDQKEKGKNGKKKVLRSSWMKQALMHICLNIWYVELIVQFKQNKFFSLSFNWWHFMGFKKYINPLFRNSCQRASDGRHQ